MCIEMGEVSLKLLYARIYMYKVFCFKLFNKGSYGRLAILMTVASNDDSTTKTIDACTYM